MKLLRRAEPDDVEQQIEALALRAHGQRLCCASCGRATHCRPGTKHTVAGLGGQQHEYGICPECSPLIAAGTLDRAVAGSLLGVDPSSDLLDGIRVERFSAVPGSRPDRPSRLGWSHVSERALARQVERRRQHEARTTSATPYAGCGTNQLLPDRGFTTWRGTMICPSCSWHLDRQFHWPTGPSDYSANWLLGRVDQHAPQGLAERLGVMLARELPEWKGHRDPWRHLDVEAIREHASSLRLDVRPFIAPW